MVLRIELLGALQVTVDGNTAVFRTDALRVLLAYLAAHRGTPQRRDRLAGLLAPDKPDKEALTYLRNRLTRLRKAVGDDVATRPWFDIDRKQIGLREGDDIFVDVVELAQLLRAVESHPHRTLAGCPTCLAKLDVVEELVRGEFLAGLNFPSETWEAWLLAQREHYAQSGLAGLTWLREARLARGEYTAVVNIAQKQLGLEPWLEGAHRAIMQAQAALGDRTAALAQYALCEQVLADELGVEPEEETVDLREAIEQNDPSYFIFHPSSFPTNLPAEMGRFIGREAEQAALLARLVDPHYRLVTLVGVGGVGKTRLAVEVGRQVGLSFPDGVWLVSLAGLAGADGEQVQTAVGEAMGLGEGEKQLTAVQVLNLLRDKQALLILDNCESVLAAPDALDFIPTWLRRAPQVAILATSREPLNLTAEAVVGLAGLPVGEEDNTAVALFAERGQMARDDFRVSDENVAQVRDICHLVDGSPLGIALAAAWVRRRSLAQIGAGIRQSLDFLTTRWRDVAPRHQSMRAVFETSWQLLAVEEQAVLAALSVFPASFDADAAQTIVGASFFELDGLCEKSLVQQDAAGERYDLHSLVRQFAAEKLGARETAIEQNFVAYFGGWAVAHKNDYVKLQPEWLNLDTAVVVAHELADWARVLGLVAALDEAWWRQARFGELRTGVRLAVDAAGKIGDEAVLAQMLLRLGEVEVELNDYGAAEAHLARALPLLMRLEDGLGLAQVNYLHGRVRNEQAQDEEALKLLTASKQLFAEEGDWLGVAKNLNLMAVSCIKLAGNFDTGRAYLTEAVAAQEKHDPTPTYVQTLRNLARVEGWTGNPEKAHTHLLTATAVSQQLGDVGEYAAVLYERVLLCKRQGQIEEALQHGRESLTQFEKLGSLRWQGLLKTQLGLLHRAQAAHEQAEAFLTAGLEIFRELGDAYEQAYSHYYLYKLYAEIGELGKSARERAEAQRLNEQLGDAQLQERLSKEEHN